MIWFRGCSQVFAILVLLHTFVRGATGATEVHILADKYDKNAYGYGLAYARGTDCLAITPQHVVRGEPLEDIRISGIGANVSKAEKIEDWRRIDLALLRLTDDALCHVAVEYFSQGANDKAYLRRRNAKGVEEKLYVEIEDYNDNEEITIKSAEPKKELQNGWSGSILYIHGRRHGMFIEIKKRGKSLTQGFVLKAAYISQVMGSNYGDPFPDAPDQDDCPNGLTVDDPSADPAQIWECLLKASNDVVKLKSFAEIHADTTFARAAERRSRTLEERRQNTAVENCRRSLIAMDAETALDLRNLRERKRLTQLFEYTVDRIPNAGARDVIETCDQEALAATKDIALRLGFPLALLAKERGQEATRYLIEAETFGATWASYLLAIRDLAKESLTSNERREAKKRLKQASDGGNLSAKLVLGLYYIKSSAVEGEGLRIKGLKLLTSAADASYPFAQFLIGNFMAGFAPGFENYQNDAEARRYLTAAQAQGFSLTASARKFVEPIADLTAPSTKYVTSDHENIISVGGAVKKPGQISLGGEEEILRKVLKYAGGLAPGANLRGIEVLRADGYREKRVRLTMPIRPGDRVHVPMK